MTGKLLVVAVVALAVRLAAVIPLHTAGQTSDEKEYVVLAQKVAAGEDFVDSNGEYSIRYPLYPYLLAALIKVFGDSRWVMYLVNALMSALVPVLCAFLARSIWADKTVALASAWAAALYPGLVVYGAVLQTESLYLVLFLAALLLAVRLAERPGLRNAIALGIAGGLAALARAVFLGFFPILLALFLVMRRRDGGQAGWRWTGVAAVVFLLVLVPWTWRNYLIHGTLIPISSLGGHLVLIGNNPYATGTWSTLPGFERWYRDELRKNGISEPDSLTEVERGRIAARVGIDYMVAHPLEVAGRVITKAHIFWFYPITNSDSNLPLQGVAVMADVLLYLAAVLGMVRMRNAGGRLVPVIGAMVFFAVLALVLHAEARYRLPLMPLICMFAGWTALPAMGEDDWRRLLLDGSRFRWGVAGAVAIIMVYAVTGWMVLTGSIAH